MDATILKNHTILLKFFTTLIIILAGLFFIAHESKVNAKEPPYGKPEDCADWDVLVIVKEEGGKIIDKKTITPKVRGGETWKDYDIGVEDGYIFYKCLYGSPDGITATGGSTSNSFDADNLPNKAIKFIQYVLGLLAIVAVAMILYGGFTWMTSGGNPQTTDRARKILLAALIGLVIVTSAWVIVSFVVKTSSETFQQ